MFMGPRLHYISKSLRMPLQVYTREPCPNAKQSHQSITVHIARDIALISYQLRFILAMEVSN